jgi:cytochrome P450
MNGIQQTGHSAASSPPTRPVDLWSDASLADPYPVYRELRDAGSAVWLSEYEMFAVPRYADVRAALKDWRVFSSAHGVMMNEPMNETMRGILLCSDPPLHDQLRSVAGRPLRPRPVRELEPEMLREADALVERLVERGTFDAVAELARHLPVTMVSRLVGLPEEGREQMLDWAAANFNCFGPMNERAQASFPLLKAAVEYSTDPTLPHRLRTGGWAAQLFEAADRGEITREQAGMMMNDYWAPSLDTTILATGNAVWLFANHPEQWDLLREDLSLMPHAINEIVRTESPIQAFSRWVTEDYQIGDTVIGAGSRAILIYGSANRDERKWEQPEAFNILRRPSDHLAFGFGEHQCMGMPLARLEMSVILTALARRVKRFELRRADRSLNNVLRGFGRLEVTVTC